jgi:hypothetical protein
MSNYSYTIDEHGIIRSPGKFEGEQSYVPYFWDIFLNGGADRDDGRVLGFDVTAEDKALFPKLRKRRTVKLYERDDGFVIEL